MARQLRTGDWLPEFGLVSGGAGVVEKHGKPDVVTSARGTSRLSQATAAQTCLVEVETYADPPAVTAFDLPEIVAE